MELIREIRPRLTRVLGNSFSRTELNAFAALCHAIALTALRSRLSSATLITRFHLSTHADVAYDCIADLFRQDAEGRLFQLKAYFDGIDVDASSDEDLISHLRRLVFSMVNQGMFRIYNELDPALGKIIRNIKLAVQTLHHFSSIDSFGEACLAPAGCETLEHLPAFERAEVERELFRVGNRGDHVPALLAKLSRVLREQNERSRVVPVVTVALAVRALYEHPAVASYTEPDALERLTHEDTLLVIKHACLRVKQETETKYVGGRKVRGATFMKYFEVIEEALIAKIANGDGAAGSLFDRLKQRMPELTREEYGLRHKARLEYLAHLAETTAIKDLRRDA